MICHCQTPCRSHRFYYCCFYCHCTRNLGHSCSKVPGTPIALSDNTHHEINCRQRWYSFFTHHIFFFIYGWECSVLAKITASQIKHTGSSSATFCMSLERPICKNTGFVNEVTIRIKVWNDRRDAHAQSRTSCGMPFCCISCCFTVCVCISSMQRCEENTVKLIVAY